MSRFKLTMVLSLAVAALLGGGLVYAEHPAGTTLPIGTATFSDDMAMSDSITYTLEEVLAPHAGTAYEGWLVADNGKTMLSTGVMEVMEDGSVSHSYTASDGANLLAIYDRLVITAEPVGDADPQPTLPGVYHAVIPQESIQVTRSLVNGMPDDGTDSVVMQLQMKIDEALLHARQGGDAAAMGDLAAAKQHVQIAVDIIDGADGVLAHAANLNAAADASSASPDSEAIAAAAAQVAHNRENIEAWVGQAKDVAVNNVMTAQTLELARVYIGPGANTVISQLEAARNGFRGLDGAEQAYGNAQMLGTFTIIPGPLPEEPPVRPGLGLPSVGDTGVPTLVSMALFGSVLFLTLGAALMVRRRSRTIS